jgi:hypothetical protein
VKLIDRARDVGCFSLLWVVVGCAAIRSARICDLRSGSQIRSAIDGCRKTSNTGDFDFKLPFFSRGCTAPANCY